MIYITETRRLYTDEGEFIKDVHCPLATQLARTVSAAEPERSFRCMHCKTEVKNLAYLSDKQALEAAQQNPDVCFFASQAAKNVVHISRPKPFFILRDPELREKVKGPSPIPVVRTARTLEDMNFAAANGFRLLFFQAGSGKDLRDIMGVYRDRITGKLHLCNDQRIAGFINWNNSKDNPTRQVHAHEEFVLPMFSFCPQGPASPIAAYLLPPGLPDNTEVFVEDIIEDLVKDYPQGSRFRTEYWFAIWTGQDLVFEPLADEHVLG
jgi:hypothetical protein